MGWITQYTYFAAKPIMAVHPPDSGIEVQYQPGDEIPASEWGRAADNLVEAGKAFRAAKNVWVDDPTTEQEGDGQGISSAAGESALPDTNTEEPNESSAPDVADAAQDPGAFPTHQGGGFYLLSDGSTVKGKQKAFAAEAALHPVAEAEES